MYILIKSLLDRLLAFLLLVVLSPLLAIILLAVMLTDRNGSPIFFQRRIGKNNVVFTIYKIKTMKTVTHIEATELSDSQRLLPIGRILRKLSLDEIPQFINIIKGDMSFIGPRPLPPQYLEYYSAEEIRRHDVKPGISGWAQVNGRNNITWDEKFELDLYYVGNISLALDIRILLLTVKKILLRSDVTIGGESSTEVNFNEFRSKGDDSSDTI